MSTVPAEPPPVARRRARSPRVVSAVFGVVAALWVVADQVLKAIAIREWGPRPVDLGWVELVDVRNVNAAFGIPGFPGLFLMVTVVVLVLVVRALPRTDRVLLGVAYGLVVGGAVGNAIDRVIRPPFFPAGAVVDWIDLGWWPVFNLADSGIVVGAGLIAVLLSRVDREERQAAAARQPQVSVRPDPQVPTG